MQQLSNKGGHSDILGSCMIFETVPSKTYVDITENMKLYSLYCITKQRQIKLGWIQGLS